jgi:hypothetical protein
VTLVGEQKISSSSALVLALLLTQGADVFAII